MLEFLVDENLPLSALTTLQEQGHGARHVTEIGMPGARDEVLFTLAGQKGWIIVTRDLRFGNLLDYSLGTHAGILILRLPSTFNAQQNIGVRKAFISDVQPDTLREALTIVEPDRYRIRRPQPGTG